VDVTQPKSDDDLLGHASLTLVIDVELFQSNYTEVTEEQAKGAGVELPIDTAEKAMKMEEYYLEAGEVGVEDHIDGTQDFDEISWDLKDEDTA